MGPKGPARKVYQKRRTEIAEGQSLSEERGRREVLLRDYLRTFMRKHVAAWLRNAVGTDGEVTVEMPSPMGYSAPSR